MPKRWQWVEQYADGLYRFALGRVHDEAAAEDLVQMTFMAGMTAKSQFQNRASPKTWLIGILKHKIVDYLRKEQPTILLEEGADLNSLFWKAFDERGMWCQPFNYLKKLNGESR